MVIHLGHGSVFTIYAPFNRKDYTKK